MRKGYAADRTGAVTVRGFFTGRASSSSSALHTDSSRSACATTPCTPFGRHPTVSSDTEASSESFCNASHAQPCEHALTDVVLLGTELSGCTERCYGSRRAYLTAAMRWSSQERTCEGTS